MRIKLVLAVALLIAVALGAPLAGSASINVLQALAGTSPDHEILFYARLPRVVLALIAGAALASTGVLFQALLRDPLAEPYTLGISSGASVGAVLAICLGWPAVWLTSAIGAGTALFLVLGVAFEGRRISSFTLLLAGVTINSISFGLILFLHNLASFTQSFAISRWLMGGIDAVDYSTLAWLGAAILPIVTMVNLRAREWNLLAVGDEWSAARGVAASTVTVAGYVAGSLMTGLVTSLTGPIGFVGLIVPHALRLSVGADHRTVMPLAAIYGAAFLAAADTLSRTALAPTEVPVGVMTALVGGPFFIWLLRSRRRSLWL